MKQLIYVPGKVGYAASYNPNDVTMLAEGSIALFKLDGINVPLSAKPTCNFGIMVGRGANNQPLVFPEVDYKSLTVVKTLPKRGEIFNANIPLPDITIGNTYTVIVVKKGVIRHERNTWTATTLAKSNTPSDVVSDLIKQLNASSETSGIKAINRDGALVITGNKVGEDYTVVCADDLLGIKPEMITGVKPILDKAFVQDLASRCAAGKGFNYTAEDAHEMYPGYPEGIVDTQHVMYTLRFAVPRVAAKQRDEVVYQTVHIVLDATSPAITTLDTIFGTGETSTASVLSEDGE